MTNLTNAMNKQDKFYEQFKEAAKKTEQHRFPGFDEVWQQVESRLDKEEEQPKIIAFNYKRWLAIAASFLVMLLAGVAIYQNNKNEAPQVTVKDNPFPEKVIIDDSNTNPVQKELSDELVRDEDTSQQLKKVTLVKTSKVLEQIQVIETVKISEESTNRITLKRIDTATLRQQPDEASVAISETSSNVITLKGIITDTLGQPVAGASVALEGANWGVFSDSTGAFLLKANKGDKLAVNSVGFDSKTIKLYESGEMKVEMTPSDNSLSEVVVVGYGMNKKRSVLGSVTKGKNPQPAPNSIPLHNQLQGKAAGVYITNDNSLKRERKQLKETPGSAPEIRIRGIASTKKGNEPLYIINGKIANGNALKSIDPGKIQNINVLKDASATALYGSRGQNGVILITTKALNKKEERELQKLNDRLLQSGIHVEPSPIDITNTEAYNPLVENPFTSPQVSPLSTFSIDVDNASYTNIRRFINNGEKVPQDAVRIEEMVNYFKYQYALPTDDNPFAAHTEYSDAPWNKEHKLLRIALKAKDIPTEQLPPSNIVFLLDVSGSMEAPNKLPLLKSSMKILLDQLRTDDKVSIVVYAGAAGLVLPPTNGNDKTTIMDALNKLNAGGSTAGGAGIELAYKIAGENFIKEGNNRVVLATDGDFNVGINSQGDLQHLIEEKRKTGIFLTCLGFGMGNYKDANLETLADKGNGNYAYIDNIQESNRFLGKEFKGTVFTVAKDVKLQIEFNPAQVRSYRLIGYENRKLNDEDFVNDKIDAGEMGIGHTVTALYEIIPVGVNSSFAPEVPKLKYSNAQPANGNGQELATLKFRYKKPDGDKSTESVQVVMNSPKPLKNASEDFRFAAAVAWFGLKLRDSELITDKTMQHIIDLAKSAKSYDPDGYRAECIRLMETAK
jgi:Ca-activated chloride channel family protein